MKILDVLNEMPEGQKSVEEVGELFKSLNTEDFQHRNNGYPKHGVPVAIDNGGSYGEQADVDFTFKNTSEDQAKRWVQGFLQAKGLPSTSITAHQDGDYHDDWVMVSAIYKP